MKIKTISRSTTAVTREKRADLVKVHRNLDPKLHPFEKAREYTRAVVAAKMDRMFAKPFVGALDGHSDSVYCCATSPKSLVAYLSGACDGEVRVWDLAHRKCLWHNYAHKNFVTGLVVAPDGRSFFSCGDDNLVKQWALQAGVAPDSDDDDDAGAAAAGAGAAHGAGGGAGAGAAKAQAADGGDGTAAEPLNEWNCKQPLTHIDHHWREPMFVTGSKHVDVWNHNRSEPVHSFSWGADSVLCVKFNPAERGLLASSASDRNIVLYDVREATPVRKLIMAHKTNKIAWNPREPFNFSIASEDSQAYTFDMRKLKSALMVHKDHVSAVMDIAYSPTGKEFVTGGYDRTVRIFPVDKPTSREVYHTKRMQRIFCVSFSADARFVLSGSDDTNVRIWKSVANQRLGRAVDRDRSKLDYHRSLKRRFGHMDEVRRISKHRHVPTAIKKAKAQAQLTAQSQKRKKANRVRHSKPGTVKTKREREKQVVRELP